MQTDVAHRIHRLTAALQQGSPTMVETVTLIVAIASLLVLHHGSTGSGTDRRPVRGEGQGR